MKRLTVLSHKFVDFIPDDLEDGTIYVSIAFATVSHKCCCGCGNEVVTPLSPADWKLIFDGESISLDPSIGNWSFPCQSHYWIKGNMVKWAPRWSQDKINPGRTHDSFVKDRYFGGTKTLGLEDTITSAVRKGEDKPKESLWLKLKKQLFH